MTQRAPALPFDLPRTRARRVMMHVADCGQVCIQFKCSTCGHDTGWIMDERTVTGNRRGMPCPKCNGGDGETAQRSENDR